MIGNMTYVMDRGNTREACALTILASVMSTSHLDHTVFDAGYKTFGAEAMIGYRKIPGFFWKGRPSFGSIQGHPDLWLRRLSAETGCVYYKDPKKRLKFGDRLEIVPNNVFTVINIQNRLYGVRNGVVEVVIPVTGRGRGS